MDTILSRRDGASGQVSGKPGELHLTLIEMQNPENALAAARRALDLACPFSEWQAWLALAMALPGVATHDSYLGSARVMQESDAAYERAMNSPFVNQELKRELKKQRRRGRFGIYVRTVSAGNRRFQQWVR